MHIQRSAITARQHFGIKLKLGQLGEMIRDHIMPKHSPAIVAAHAPHSDAHDGLWVEHSAVHGVHQAKHVVLQDQVHVFPLDVMRKHVIFLMKLHTLMFVAI